MKKHSLNFIKTIKENLTRSTLLYLIPCLMISIASVILTFTIFSSAFVNLLNICKTAFDSFITSLYFIITGDLPQKTIGITNPVSPSNDIIPVDPPHNIIPQDVKVFESDVSLFWSALFKGDNFLNYFTFIGTLSIYILRLLPFFVLFHFLVKGYVRRLLTYENNDYNKDTNCLRGMRSFSNTVYLPVKKYFIGLFEYISAFKFSKLWLFIWCFNFNIFSVLILFISFSFSFSVTFNFSSMYYCIYDTITLLMPTFKYIPWYLWLFVVMYFINKWRIFLALKKLNHMELCNKGFISNRSICSMFVGSMGTGKTTLVTDIALSTESIFRYKALELMIDKDLEFPNFPYIILENAIKDEIKNDRIVNLAQCDAYVRRSENLINRIILRAEKRGISYDYVISKLSKSDLIWQYDCLTYGLKYDDKKTQINLFDSLRDYVKLYFIYIVNSSLIISNYAIRTDFIKASKGNFPKWDLDFFERDSKLLSVNSRHSHVLDFDMLRLGKKLIENNKNTNAFEFGVIAITEIGKERGNQFKSQELKDTIKQLRTTIKELNRLKIDSSVYQNELESLTNRATVLTDKFNDTLKLIRHKCTVCGFPFARVFLDEQRPESLGSDARELCEIVHIRGKTDTSLAMPFFFIMELIYSFTFGRFIRTYNDYRFNRGDNTAFMFLIKKVFVSIHQHYMRMYNRFGYHVRRLSVEDGATGQVLRDSEYYLMNKKIYSNRFSTDAYYEIFTRELRNSSIGIEQMKEYQFHKASEEELLSQNSYFINEITKHKIQTDTPHLA